MLFSSLLVIDIPAGHLSLKQNQGEGKVPRHGAVSFEQSEWPDGVNHPEWMNRKTLWGKLDTYNGHISYKFKVDRKQEAARDAIN